MSRATARFWAVIICLLFLSFGGYYLYRYFSDDYRTENAYEFTVVPSYFAKGLIIRTEPSVGEVLEKDEPELPEVIEDPFDLAHDAVTYYTAR